MRSDALDIYLDVTAKAALKSGGSNHRIVASDGWASIAASAADPKILMRSHTKNIRENLAFLIPSHIRTTFATQENNGFTARSRSKVSSL